MHLLQAVSDQNFFYLVPWVVFFPAIGLLINLIFGGWLKEKVIGGIASLAVVASFVVAVLLAITLTRLPGGDTIHLLDWIAIGNLQVAWAFRVDTLSVTMMTIFAS